MTHARFYAPALARGDSLVRLPLEEARHLLRVLRLRPGDAVRVFNGAGVEYAGLVAAVDRDEVTISLEREVEAAPEAVVNITLAQALLKGDDMDGVVRDAVMLGVTGIVPLLSAHVEGERRGRAAGLRVPRWERVVMASAKQCGRAVVPRVATPTPLATCLLSVAADVRVVLAEPASSLPAESLADLAAAPRPRDAVLFVGPEGGWAEDELRLFAGYGCRAVTLGPRTLRAESAAIVGLSVLHTLWGEFR